MFFFYLVLLFLHFNETLQLFESKLKTIFSLCKFMFLNFKNATETEGLLIGQHTLFTLSIHMRDPNQPPPQSTEL